MRIIGGIEIEPCWQGKPKDPIRDVLQWIVGARPPKFVKGYSYEDLTDEQHMQLQDWVCMNLHKTNIWWSTGIGIIDAAEKMVQEAVSNGNIPPVDSKWREEGAPAKLFPPRKKVRDRKKVKKGG